MGHPNWVGCDRKEPVLVLVQVRVLVAPALALLMRVHV
jgi:hypothetical protein